MRAEEYVLYDKCTISRIGSILYSVTLVAPGISENRFWTYYYLYHS